MLDTRAFTRAKTSKLRAITGSEKAKCRENCVSVMMYSPPGIIGSNPSSNNCSYLVAIDWLLVVAWLQVSLLCVQVFRFGSDCCVGDIVISPVGYIDG